MPALFRTQNRTATPLRLSLPDIIPAFGDALSVLNFGGTTFQTRKTGPYCIIGQIVLVRIMTRVTILWSGLPTARDEFCRHFRCYLPEHRENLRPLSWYNDRVVTVSTSRLYVSQVSEPTRNANSKDHRVTALPTKEGE